MAISKKTIRDIDVAGKRVLMRVDFNVPMKDGVVQDDTRIRAALPSIKYVLEKGCKSLVLMSHLGDPKKDMQKAKERRRKTASRSTNRNTSRENTRWRRSRRILQSCSARGKARARLHGARNRGNGQGHSAGWYLMLENTRFHKEETSKDPAEREKMAKALAQYGDVYVNDAFGTAHRPHASTETVAHYLPGGGRILMEKELEYLEEK